MGIRFFYADGGPAKLPVLQGERRPKRNLREIKKEFWKNAPTSTFCFSVPFISHSKTSYDIASQNIESSSANQKMADSTTISECDFDGRSYWAIGLQDSQSLDWKHGTTARRRLAVGPGGRH
jgi:hypothetical protein